MKLRSLCCFVAVVVFPLVGFPAGKQLTGPYAPAATPALAPAEAEKKFVVPPGFEVRLFAAEPDVINPVAMTWDERGRLWVLELYEYPLGAPPGAKPRDRIKILEDTDNDGRADKVTIFADGLNLATGLLLGNGGAYVGQAPDLLFLQDTNHDDVADTRKVLLTGFGLDDRHELLNGFAWGPDGRLYMTQGVFTHSKVRIPEATEPGIEMTAAVARFDPRNNKFDVFADGTSNPWGVDFDRYGNAFVSACVIDHLFHMAPGGIYQRQSGTPANPYAYELLPSIVEHKHYRAAYCGICIYQGDQFPAEYRGHVFVGNIHQNAINHDRLIPNGSSFKAIAEKDFLTTSDGWFRPVSEQVGPDGALWIADWCDKYPCYQNAQADPDGVDRERGRIWRVVYTGKQPGKTVPTRPTAIMDLSKLSNHELIKLLDHPNEWQRRMAQRILSERGADRVQWERRKQRETGKEIKKEALRLELAPPASTDTGPGGMRPIWPPETELQFMISSTNIQTRLAALWTLRSWDWEREDTNSNWAWVLEECLESDERVMRSWAVRFAAEDIAHFKRLPGTRKDIAFYERMLGQLEKLAGDPDPSVRLAVATAARQLVSTSLTIDTDIDAEAPIGKILAALIKSSADAKDPLLPFMIWMAGEPIIAANPRGGLDWISEHGAETMPLSGILARKAMRRICDTQDRNKLDVAVNFVAGIADKSDALATAAIQGLIEGQQAKPLLPGAEIKPLFVKLNASADKQLRERAQQLGTLWGDEASVEATLAMINNSRLSLNERTGAIEVARKLKTEDARTPLRKIIANTNPVPLVVAAMQALGEMGGPTDADFILTCWKTLAPESRAAAAEVLVTRNSWAIALLSAIEAKQISALELPMPAIRALGDSKDDDIRQQTAKVVGRIRPANADKQKIIAQKKQIILAGGPPDLQAGHDLAKKTCLICHKLYSEGADVGPDLTGVGRSSLDALLVNVIDPNLVVGKGYENVEVETKDGRSLSGRLTENTDTRIKLLSAGPKEEIIAKSDIANMRVSELSVMPEGLEQMPDADFRNLILFVLTAKELAK